MSLISLQQVNLAFGGPAVLSGASLSIELGDRVCLLGRNGAGKSTLLKLLAGNITPDTGQVVKNASTIVSVLPQDIPDHIDGTFFDVCASGLGEPGRLLAKYHAASLAVSISQNERSLKELDQLHSAVDSLGAWQLNTKVESILGQLSLNADMVFNSASGGLKRQVLLARALVAEPDVLLLDEPTNHMDIAAIERMEQLLIDKNTTLVFVTHDRAFLRRVATRLVELDRGKLSDWGSDYDTYLERRDAALSAELKEWEEFDKRLADEEKWIRTGIQARRTRNEGRVRALEAMRNERKARRERTGVAGIQINEAERSGKLVFEALNVNFAYGDRPMVKDFSTRILRGDKVGLIGPNGVGKTTLLKLMLGDLEQSSGTIKQGTNLELAWFDQLREQLDPDSTVFNSIADGSEFVDIAGNRRHVNSWLQDFLFSPDRARSPVRSLSGGERSRLLLARLFTRSFNVLVLDEPTNDLDMETLDLLEEKLLSFGGTLLLVSHDREFLDAVVTSTFVFEGSGTINEYAGGYSDYLSQRPEPVISEAKSAHTPKVVSHQKAAKKRKLSFKEARELESLPADIDKAEEERESLYLKLSEPETLRMADSVRSINDRIEQLGRDLETMLARWEELESIAQS